MHSTVLGSTPKGTFCVLRGLNSSSASFFARSAALLSASRWAFSASFRLASGVLLDWACACNCVICFLAEPPFFCPSIAVLVGVCSKGESGRDVRFSCQRSVSRDTKGQRLYFSKSKKNLHINTYLIIDRLLLLRLILLLLGRHGDGVAKCGANSR